jgi:3-hydroxyisobutyrate dehydrogenase-like beta-hydroxyacid dehydrogenase
MAIGIISAGHMGSGLGWALREGGARVMTTVDGRSARTAGLAANADIELAPDLPALLREAMVLLVVTPPGAARAAATAIAAAARDTGTAPLVADLNAIAPSTVDDIAQTYHEAGLNYVDGSISGPPPNVRPGARLYFSGPRAGEIAGLPWRHVQPIVLAGPIGRASALKMCTASVYKGLDGLVAQAMRAAAHYGVLDEAVADLRTAGRDRTVGVAVAATKAHRYVPEMREIAATQAGAGLTATLFESFAQVYSEIATSRLGQEDPESVDRDLSPADVVRGITPGHQPGT